MDCADISPPTIHSSVVRIFSVMTSTFSQAPAYVAPAHFDDPDAALAQVRTIYDNSLNHLRERWLNPPEWVDVVPEVLVQGQKRYPDRVIPKPEFALKIKERTLTKLYNERPKWLQLAHAALDSAVAAAYGWADYSEAMPDAEILRRLLALNLARAKDELP